ncbi:MAG: hypothetical protein H6502_04785 [Candidatus Woesearchaeota archaeon]|nr:MAG: hypothetical protein H6502_04785 [Candidatus Woesearchaeota archaeon]
MQIQSVRDVDVRNVAQELKQKGLAISDAQAIMLAETMVKTTKRVSNASEEKRHSNVMYGTNDAKHRKEQRIKEADDAEKEKRTIKDGPTSSYQSISSLKEQVKRMLERHPNSVGNFYVHNDPRLRKQPVMKEEATPQTSVVQELHQELTELQEDPFTELQQDMQETNEEIMEDLQELAVQDDLAERDDPFATLSSEVSASPGEIGETRQQEEQMQQLFPDGQKLEDDFIMNTKQEEVAVSEHPLNPPQTPTTNSPSSGAALHSSSPPTLEEEREARRQAILQNPNEKTKGMMEANVDLTNIFRV